MKTTDYALLSDSQLTSELERARKRIASIAAGHGNADQIKMAEATEAAIWDERVRRARIDRCENCSSAGKLPGERIVLYRTVGRGLVCAACIRANRDRDPAFEIDATGAARRMGLAP